MTSGPAFTLVLRDRQFLPHPSRPLVMGILNAGPESFSDDGHTTLDDQIERATDMIDAGAHIIDVGGESGVTNRPPITADEEIRRVKPVVEALVDAGVTVSVDTWKAPVARAVLDAGAHLINDVSGLGDGAIAEHCARHEAGLVVMHTRAAPKTKAFPGYDDVVAEVVDFLADRMAIAEGLGVKRDRLVLDPGPDFAKTPSETVTVLRRLADVVALGRPVLLAVSRKDFVGALVSRLPRERQAGTLAAVGAGLDAGASIVRVHDVAETVDFLKVRAALLGGIDVPAGLTLPEHLRRQPT